MWQMVFSPPAQEFDFQGEQGGCVLARWFSSTCPGSFPGLCREQGRMCWQDSFPPAQDTPGQEPKEHQLRPLAWVALACSAHLAAEVPTGGEEATNCRPGFVADEKDRVIFLRALIP